MGGAPVRTLARSEGVSPSKTGILYTLFEKHVQEIKITVRARTGTDIGTELYT